MIRAETVDEFATRPGRYYVGDRLIAFCPDPSLYGFVLWGAHDDETLLAMGTVLDAQYRRVTQRHSSVADLSRVDRFDLGSYRRLIEFLAARAPLFARYVDKQVVLRPSGPNGMIVAGFVQTVPPPHPVVVVETPAEAGAALGDPRVPSLLAETDRVIRDQARRRTTEALLAWLGDRPARKSLTDAARAVGMSSRTLQRRLAEEGTTFQGELDRVRIAVAKRLLLTTSAKLTVVALEIGCSSPQHFSDLFRRVTGLSPTVWRQRNRL